MNVSENFWISFSDCAIVLIMPRYGYNNIIIIVTNVIILEFLSAWFVHPCTLLPSYLFLNELEHKNNES